MTEPDERAEMAQHDEHGLTGNPVTEDEIDPDIHDRLGFDHSDGPAPVRRARP